MYPLLSSYSLLDNLWHPSNTSICQIKKHILPFISHIWKVKKKRFYIKQDLQNNEPAHIGTRVWKSKNLGIFNANIIVRQCWETRVRKCLFCNRTIARVTHVLSTRETLSPSRRKWYLVTAGKRAYTKLQLGNKLRTNKYQIGTYTYTHHGDIKNTNKE